MSLDDDLAAALRTDYTTANVSDQDRAILAFSVKLTRHPQRMTAADTQGLRDVGLTDQAVLQVTMIAAWFNYVNRVADALGLGRPRPG